MAFATNQGDLARRYSYSTRYIADADVFMEKVLAKTIVPHQLEIQPGRIKGEALCWMSCPYCYGGTAKNTGERLSSDRLVEVLKQTAAGPNGGIDKLVFAGYATDPLNYEHVDDLLATGRDNRQIVGFHTKALRVSDRFVSELVRPDGHPMSYFSVSVDAGRSASYNEVHGITATAKAYDKVLRNLRRITDARRASGARVDVSATYLVTRVNNSSAEVEKSVRDLLDSGIDLLRFSFPQVPRGLESEQGTIIPSRAEVDEYMSRLPQIIHAADSPAQRVIIADYDAELGIDSRRTLPCVARFVFPSIGYDGFLGHCSESAAPHFRDMTLGNLAERDFWDLYYDYDTTDFWNYMNDAYAKMERNDCRCDRKEHAVNSVMGHFLTARAQTVA